MKAYCDISICQPSLAAERRAKRLSVFTLQVQDSTARIAHSSEKGLIPALLHRVDLPAESRENPNFVPARGLHE
jgi:hypothetical protein